MQIPGAFIDLCGYLNQDIDLKNPQYKEFIFQTINKLNNKDIEIIKNFITYAVNEFDDTQLYDLWVKYATLYHISPPSSIRDVLKIALTYFP